MLPGLKTPDGALYIIESAPAAGDPASGGVSMTNDGWVHVDGLLPPQVFANGFGFRNNGALCINKFGTAIAGYHQGLPFNSVGQLVCQLNQPVSPGDSYVGGLRVGPLGGLYVVDAAPVWTPAVLFASGEQGVWYDPSDLTTMFQDREGTTPVTADGQTVGKILDKSGLGNHAVAPSDAARPLYKTDGTYHWLQFDGVDDSMSTAAINFTATDKMSVFCGVRKLSDANTGLVTELSADTNANNGCFFVASPLNTGVYGDFGILSKGTTYSGGAMQVVSAPSTAVLCGIADISAPLNRLIVNSGVATDFTESQGLGNFGTYPLYIGSRGGVSLFLNGSLYSLIVRGALSTADEITNTETWVNSKTGAF